MPANHYCFILVCQAESSAIHFSAELSPSWLKPSPSLPCSPQLLCNTLGAKVEFWRTDVKQSDNNCNSCVLKPRIWVNSPFWTECEEGEILADINSHTKHGPWRNAISMKSARGFWTIEGIIASKTDSEISNAEWMEQLRGFYVYGENKCSFFIWILKKDIFSKCWLFSFA